MRAPTLAPRIALACAAALAGPAQAADGELRLHWDDRGAATPGPLAAANALQPGLVAPSRSAWVAEAEFKHTLTLGEVTLAGNLLAAHERPEGGPGRDASRVNELHAGLERGAWAVSAGRKIVAWDVGYAFRPNDVVQQEVRRTLTGSTQAGRPLLQAEWFGSDAAASVVWVNPTHVDESAGPWRGADESALAARGYWRLGALDVHGFARAGRHGAGSLGAALAWVASDEVELHASLRALQRHDGWAFDPAAGNAPVRSNPWAQATLGAASQALVGMTWTGTVQQSLIVEAWHDGTAPTNAQWRAWGERNAALLASAAPVAARAGNLAWQATPLAGPSLRQDNVFVRLAWQPGPWQFSLDALWAPADGGRNLTAAVQWQGDRWRLNAALRQFGGPATSLAAQLPVRRQGLLMATLSF